MSKYLLILSFFATLAIAQDDPVELDSPQTVGGDEASDEVKTLSGMSILGNEEAPKSLVIVPWKSSRLGDGLGIANSLDESPLPVDKEVFMRELHFYGLRSGSDE